MTHMQGSSRACIFLTGDAARDLSSAQLVFALATHPRGACVCTSVGTVVLRRAAERRVASSCTFRSSMHTMMGIESQFCSSGLSPKTPHTTERSGPGAAGPRHCRIRWGNMRATTHYVFPLVLPRPPHPNARNHGGVPPSRSAVRRGSRCSSVRARSSSCRVLATLSTSE